MGIVIRNTGSNNKLRFSGAGGGFKSYYTPPAAFSFLLNEYPTASAAYSLRKLDSSYNGSAIRVRRSSDNTEQDIGFVNNQLDTASLTSFVGANNGFVSVWYDQSGNNNNVTQSAATNQPTIVSTGTINLINNKPAILFNSGNATVLSRAGVISGSSSRTQIAVYKPNLSSGIMGIFGQGYDAGTGTWSYIQARTLSAAGDPYFAGYAADLGNGLTTMDTNLKIGSFMYDGTTGYLWKNNTQITSGNLTLNTNINQRIQVGNGGGGTGTSNEFLLGSISECILYLSNNLSNISAINTNINSYYSIY